MDEPIIRIHASSFADNELTALIDFPITTEQINNVFRILGIDDRDESDISFNNIECSVDGIFDVIHPDASFADINRLALLLESMNEENRQKLSDMILTDAVIMGTDKAMDIKEAINIAVGMNEERLLEGGANMPSYTLDELIKIMEPQAQRDKALINRCIDGLEIYAAQQAQAGNNQRVIEMRELVENLACYWGLIEGENAKPLEDYIASFDSLIMDAKAGMGFTDISLKSQENTMYGLFRYGNEMVVAQGSDAVFDILHISKLMKEIAACWHFESDVLDNMIGQLEAEVQKMAGREELMNECIAGLGHYAAQQVKDNYFSSKQEEMRVLIETLYNYFGLDNGDSENASSLDDILDKYDEQIHAAKYNKEIDKYLSSEYEVGAIFGLYRYGEDMTMSQGSDAMSDILDIGDLMQDIASYWDFKPYDVVVDLSDRLRTEVRSMLADIPLPGQPVSGTNVGYQIRQAILFNNDRGFVLAHHPKAPAPFVTWQFVDRENGRSYDDGSYFATEERARLSYLTRISDYIEAYKVTEKSVPTAAAEMDTEQNYNMVDGVRNNEDFTQPDLTDGQTDAEIRELAPEMLPDETAAEDRRIPVQVLSEGQPMVTVTFSEHEQLRNIVKLPLYLANTLFFEADEKQNTKYFEALHSPEPIGHYLKTDFRIDFIMNGKPDSYSGRFDVGIGDQTLTEHIQEHAAYYRNNEDHQDYLDSRGEKETANAQYDIILNELVPYFDKHCELSKKEAAALSELMEIHEDAGGNPSDSAKVRIEYLEAVVEQCYRSRTALNGTELGVLPEYSRPTAEVAGDKSGRNEKASVLDRIKESRTAPKTPAKPKPEREKKTPGQEL